MLTAGELSRKWIRGAVGGKDRRLSRVDLHIRGGRLQLQGNRIENKADVTAIFRAVGDLNHL